MESSEEGDLVNYKEILDPVDLRKYKEIWDPVKKIWGLVDPYVAYRKF